MRRTLIIVVAAIAIAATAGAAYWRYAGSVQQSQIPEILSYAPSDTKSLLYVDVAAIRSSAFGKDVDLLSPSTKADREYLDFVTATGFDFTRDLDRVLIVPKSGLSALSLAIVEGRFDHAKISAYASRRGQARRENGVEFFDVQPVHPSDPPTSFLFLAENRIAFAQGADAHAVLAALPRNPDESRFDPGMRERLIRVAGSAIFGIAQMSDVPYQSAMDGLHSDQLNSLLRDVRWVTFGMRPDGEILHIGLDGECSNADNAHQLSGVLDGLRFLGRAVLSDPKSRGQMPPQAQSFADSLLNNIRITQDSVRVRLTLDISRSDIHRLFGPDTATPSSTSRQ